MFIAALLTIAKTWKHPKCPLTDEWIKKRWFIYIMEYYSDIKKNERMPFAATGMDLNVTRLSEVIQRQISYGRVYMWHLKKMIQMNLFTK